MVSLENLQWNFSRDNLWRLIENLYPSLGHRWLLSAFVRVDLAVFKLRLRKRGKMIGAGDRKCRVWAIDHFRFDASSYVARYRQSMIARSCYKIDRTAQFSHYRESEDNRATLRSISLWILRNSAETIDPIPSLRVSISIFPFSISLQRTNAIWFATTTESKFLSIYEWLISKDNNYDRQYHWWLWHSPTIR